MRRHADKVALLLAAPAAGIGVLAQGGRFSSLLDVFTHFALPLIVLSLTAGLIWLAGKPRRRMTLLLALVGLASALSLVAPEVVSRPAASPLRAGEQSLTLLQFNVWKDNPRPQQTLEWIAQANPDIAAIEDSRGEGEVIVSALAARFPYSAHIGDSWVFSRYPITGWRQLRVGASLIAHVQTPSGEASVAVTHLAWPLMARMQAWQRRRLIDELSSEPKGALILAGDFNLTPWSFAMTQLDRGLGMKRLTHGQPTWPARWALIPALLPIDQVFAGEDWRVVKLERGPRLGSDHYPVLVVLARKPTGPPPPSP